MTGRATVELKAPLGVYRTRAGSLSREDFAPGWDHPARISFWQRARVVHDGIRSGRRAPSDALTRITPPARFLDASVRKELDVVFVGDWRGCPLGLSGHYLAEALALRSRGKRVGILQIEDLRRVGERLGPMDSELLRLLNARQLDEVYLDDGVVAHSVVVRDAGVLSYVDDRPSRVRTDNLVVVVDGVPIEASSRGSFSLLDSLRRAERIFATRATVVGADLASRQAVRSILTEGDARVSSMPYLGVAQSRLRRIVRPGRIMGPPVVGMVVESPFDVPDPQTLGHLLLQSVDVRLLVLGDLSIDGLPNHTLMFRVGDVDLAEYLAQVDFLLDFAPVSRPRPVIFSALAAGCVVIARSERRSALGDAAVYVQPERAAVLYDALRGDDDAYSGCVDRARAFAIEQLGEATWIRRAARLGICPDEAIGGISE